MCHILWTSFTSVKFKHICVCTSLYCLYMFMCTCTQTYIHLCSKSQFANIHQHVIYLYDRTWERHRAEKLFVLYMKGKKKRWAMVLRTTFKKPELLAWELSGFDLHSLRRITLASSLWSHRRISRGHSVPYILHKMFLCTRWPMWPWSAHKSLGLGTKSRWAEESMLLGRRPQWPQWACSWATLRGAERIAQEGCIPTHSDWVNYPTPT